MPTIEFMAEIEFLKDRLSNIKKLACHIQDLICSDNDPCDILDGIDTDVSKILSIIDNKNRSKVI